MKPFYLSVAVCTAAIFIGGVLVAVFGYAPPARLLALEVALFSFLALGAGFGLCRPTLPGWVWSRPFMGAVSIVVGVGALYVPASFIVSAFFLGIGTRLVWLAACDLEGGDRLSPPSTAIVRRREPTELLIQREGRDVCAKR